MDEVHFQLPSTSKSGERIALPRDANLEPIKNSAHNAFQFSRLKASCTALLIALSCFFPALSGCGSQNTPEEQPGTITITASPASIAAGSSSTLTVAAANATQVLLTGSDGSSYTLQAMGGTQSVSPSATTTYTATANGTGGTASSKTTVTVNPAPTVSILANPTVVIAGGSSVLTVSATNASQVTIAGSDGSNYTLSATGGTQTVSPSANTTYTATAIGSGGTVSSKAIVTVNPAPNVNIVANPTVVIAGGASVLTVSATNATQVTIAGSDGSNYTLTATGGTQTVSPSATTTYTATATGSGGTVSSKAIVTVNPAPNVNIVANPTAVITGSSSILTVIATNALQVAITGTDGSQYTLSATGGTQPVSPAATTTYTATATGTGGTTSSTATLTITPNPVPTVNITANPASIRLGSSSTLTVTTSYATQVTVTGTDGSSYTLTPSGGLQSVAPVVTTTYTATATGAGGTTIVTATVTVEPNPPPAVTIFADPSTIVAGNPATLTVAASNATQVAITGSDGSSYTLSQATGGTQSVTPTTTTTYTATATGGVGTTPVTTFITVTLAQAGSIAQINHVIFMLQENRSFDSYFGMLNPYRVANGWNIGDDGNTYTVDGIDDKLDAISNEDDEGTSFPLFRFNSTCIDEMTPFWSSSFGDVSTYNSSTTRPILMDGFVHNAEGYASYCTTSGTCSGKFTDLTGQRSMGYYDQGYLNYYYYMASQFAVSDRWFSPVADYSINNRIATFSGGTTQGLVRAPSSDDLPQLAMPNIFQELDQANVSWKVYYTVTNGFCLDEDECPGGPSALYPATEFSDFTYSYRYMFENPSQATCAFPTQPSSVVGDSSNSFCIDPTHIAPLSTYFSDLSSGTLPSFSFIEAGYGNNDEHPGSLQSILVGQAQVANVVNALMSSYLWIDSVFFFSYDEGGGAYDHVPPVPGYSTENTDASLGTISDISTIAVNPDGYFPCLPAGGTPTTHCDLSAGDPGSVPGDVVATEGFAAQLGFRLPNAIISPFTRRHYVSHTPMDHTAVIKFVENRFIGSAAHLTARDAAQPDLLEFFDFTNIPWATSPTPPVPASNSTLGHNPCTPKSM